MNYNYNTFATFSYKELLCNSTAYKAERKKEPVNFHSYAYFLTVFLIYYINCTISILTIILFSIFKSYHPSNYQQNSGLLRNENPLSFPKNLRNFPKSVQVYPQRLRYRLTLKRFLFSIHPFAQLCRGIKIRTCPINGTVKNAIYIHNGEIKYTFAGTVLSRFLSIFRRVLEIGR